ncbi:alpha/beta fold hydrolase [Streptomyces sp. NPDC088261]|uniref:alpha/beta fold hydrolase n=1 Tax=Streptomyces sp. NPDC088261 TaxID=3365851 RepID=UPI0037F6F88C
MSRASRAADDVVAQHHASGHTFRAGGIRGFTLDRGEGPPVVCLHGAPTSSFLYRKLVPELAARGFRAVAPDFPGAGLGARPLAFDYSWSGLARWTDRAMDALGIDRCHLVVHDTGGPVGFEWAITRPGRVLSLTALDTLVDVAAYRPPPSMRPFTVPVAGEAWLPVLRPPVSRRFFRRVGLADGASLTDAEVDAHLALVTRQDAGRAFLRTMRGFELTDAKQAFYYEGLASRPYPAQVVWARDDPILGLPRLRAVLDALGVGSPTVLAGRHYLQEEQSPAIAATVAELAGA